MYTCICIMMYMYVHVHVHVFECNDVMYYKVGVYYMLSNIEVRIIYVHVHVCMHWCELHI